MKANAIFGVLKIMFVCVALVTGFILYKKASITSFCATPITYTLGNIDPKFEITQNELKNITQKAAENWKYNNQTLFKYDPNSKLDINLIYNEKHAILKSINKDENNVSQKLNDLTSNYSTYDQKKADLEKKIQNLNQRIDEWNKNPDNSEEEYNQIKQEAAEVNQQLINFNQYSQTLNQEAQKYNKDIDNLNKEINQFNTALSTNPEMGLYTSGEHTIEIFFYANKKELESVISHEMGHALGLDHINVENALMNPTSSSSTIFTPQDKELLVNMCTSKTQIDRFKYDLINTLYPLREKLRLKIMDTISKFRA